MSILYVAYVGRGENLEEYTSSFREPFLALQVILSVIHAARRYHNVTPSMTCQATEIEAR